MKIEASKKLSALMASILNSNLREGGSSTYIIEWGHIAEYIRMLIKMKIRCKDFYRILARPEAYKDNGFDQVNVTALARLRDYDNHEDRAGYYKLVKLQIRNRRSFPDFSAPLSYVSNPCAGMVSVCLPV
jgi:hypothetical protein